MKSTALTTPGRSDLHLDEYRQAFEDFIGSYIGEYSLEKARQSIASSPALQDYLSSLNADADSDDLFNQRSNFGGKLDRQIEAARWMDWP